MGGSHRLYSCGVPLIPEAIPLDLDQKAVCGLSDRWLISGELASRLIRMNQYSIEYFGYRWQIISGFRSRSKQLQLKAEGRPAADPDRSTHCSCPATGADVWPTTGALGNENDMKAQLGHCARLSGLRWGGGSPPDKNGIPSDWNHLDLGPRTASP